MARVQPRHHVPKKSFVGFFPLITAFFLGYICSAWLKIDRVGQWFSQYAFVKTTPPSSSPLAKKLPTPEFQFYTLLAQDQNQPTSTENKPLSNPTTAATKTPTTTTAKAAEYAELQKITGIPQHTQKSAPPTSSPATHSSSMLEVEVTKVPSPFLPQKTNTTEPIPHTTPGNKWYIQLGAFQRSLDAQRMQSALQAKGLQVQVVSSQQQQIPWHKVMLGPFTSFKEAQKMQTIMSRTEKVNGIIRKESA
ncbi:MAG: SPOR domain-containing protein [Legionellaceae bacterium]|nr:SPOR domain-containing protein [Legionellaceae bacterium]